MDLFHTSLMLTSKVVPKESAVLGLPDLREVKVYLNRSHSQICKFSNAEDPEWESTRKVLCQAAEAARSANYTPTLSKRQDMFKSIRPHHRCTTLPNT